jgi:hypothetical protein
MQLSTDAVTWLRLKIEFAERQAIAVEQFGDFLRRCHRLLLGATLADRLGPQTLYLLHQPGEVRRVEAGEPTEARNALAQRDEQRARLRRHDTRRHAVVNLLADELQREASDAVARAPRRGLQHHQHYAFEGVGKRGLASTAHDNGADHAIHDVLQIARLARALQQCRTGRGARQIPPLMRQAQHRILRRAEPVIRAARFARPIDARHVARAVAHDVGVYRLRPAYIAESRSRPGRTMAAGRGQRGLIQRRPGAGAIMRSIRQARDPREQKIAAGEWRKCAGGKHHGLARERVAGGASGGSVGGLQPQKPKTRLAQGGQQRCVGAHVSLLRFGKAVERGGAARRWLADQQICGQQHGIGHRGLLAPRRQGHDVQGVKPFA